MSTPSPDHAIDRRDDWISRLPLRQRKKLRTRKAIQEHALRLFAEQGYDETTVEQIAAAAEISPSTFFRYFPTKEDVVVTDEYDRLMADIVRAQPPELSPIDALRAMLHEILPQDVSELETIKTRMRLTARVPALRARMFESMHEGTFAVLTGAIGERTGRAPDDPDVEVFTSAVLGVMKAAMYQLMDGRIGYDELTGVIDHNLEFLSRGCPL